MSAVQSDSLKKHRIALVALPTLFLASLYLFAYTAVRAREGSFGIVIAVFSAAVILGAAVILLAGFCATASSGSADMRARMRRIALAFKLLAVPFFIANFAVWAFIFGVIGSLPGAQFLWLILPLVQILTFCVLAVTSSYSICTIILYRKAGLITTAMTLRHCLLQLLFVIDVMDWAYLYTRFKKYDRTDKTDIFRAEQKKLP